MPFSLVPRICYESRPVYRLLHARKRAWPCLSFASFHISCFLLSCLFFATATIDCADITSRFLMLLHFPSIPSSRPFRSYNQQYGFSKLSNYRS